MTALRDILVRQVSRLGPLTVADYMAQALYHPDHGYYTKGRPLGATGDFTTAPEISQMFGELVGLSLAQSWLDQGAPKAFTFAELGPGSGQLMADALRATRHVPGFHDAFRLVLVDCNPHLMQQQSDRLDSFAPAWVAQAEDLPDGPLWLIANEFFDCLPMRQFVRHEDWQEQVVAVRNDALCFATRSAPDVARALPDRPKGSVTELRPAANAILGDISDRIARHGGAALIIDYGNDGSDGDTLQAVRHHQKVDPLEDPGNVDLTSHVDFAALRQAAQKVQCSATTPQGVFLDRLGIGPRAQKLAQHLTGATRDAHLAAHRRLTHPSEMGEVFKAIGIAPKGAPLPPGLDP